MASDTKAAKYLPPLLLIPTAVLGVALFALGLPALAAMSFAMTVFVLSLVALQLSGFVPPGQDGHIRWSKRRFRFSYAVFTVGGALNVFSFVSAVRDSDRDQALDSGGSTAMFAAFLLLTLVLRRQAVRAQR